VRLDHSMQADELVTTYLRALSTSDADLAISLFAPGGTVRSPLYGSLPAVEFYPALFGDTGESRLTLRSVMRGEDHDGEPTLSFWFHFDWRLPSGVAAPFDVVDVAQLDRDGLIVTLHIVYDTVGVRPVFEAETGRRSWREAT
jgi:hypothetical protein